MQRRDLILSGLATAVSSGVLSRFGTTAANSEPRIDQLDGAAYQLRSSFLDDLRRRCYRYFVEAADPRTGLISDRASTDGSSFSTAASIAACGFGLAAHGVAAQAGLTDATAAEARAERMLQSLVSLVQHERGFAYHFIDRTSGARMFNCEASSIDTALMVAGAIHARQTFNHNPRIGSLCDELYGRIEWRWMLGDNGCLHMGWTPETGRLPYQWDTFSELTILVLLALGAPTDPIPSSSWQAWKRDQVLHYKGQSFLSYPPLFVHQYPTAFFDFRYLRCPTGINFFQNSQLAHYAQIDYLRALAQQYPERMGHYGDDLWGITSSDSHDGYRDWGGPYRDSIHEPERGIDGTVVPSAAAGALPIVPDQALHTLMYQRDRFGAQIYGRYGFANAFNPATGWVGPDVIGIDTGISLLMAENLVSGQVWKAFMSHDSAQRALRLAGFQQVTPAS